MEKELLEFCERFSIEEKKLNRKSSIRVDMGLDGIDADYFISDFQSAFKIELNDFDFLKYFHSEDELFGFSLFGFSILKKRTYRNIEHELLIEDLLNHLRARVD